MLVLKGDGSKQEFDPNKLTARIKVLEGRSSFRWEKIDVEGIVKSVSRGIFDGITSEELDTLLMEQTATKIIDHPDYSYLASAIAVSNMHYSQNTLTFSQKTEVYAKANMLNPDYAQYVRDNSEWLDSLVDYTRDYEHDYFGISTLRRAYLLKGDGRILETPTEMFLRTAITVHMGDKASIERMYNDIGRKYIHATPTLFNSGLKKQQLASCFLMAMQEDSIDGIYDTLKQTAKISQSAGGIGIHIHNVRAKGSKIKSVGGESDGIVPMLRVFNDTARYVNQAGRRNGAFAIYLEPWHADVEDFLELKKNHGKEEMRARDLFYAMWVPDLFMERVETDGDWTLFSPDEAPGLADVVGDDFKGLYERYESEGRGRKTIKARKLYSHIVTSQIETGMPYMVYKDAANLKSNQQNLGVIKSSNLCCVAGDQRVPTNKGMLTAKELYEEGTANIVVGREKFEIATPMLLPKPNAEMVKIHTKEGYTHKVTPDHKVWVKDIGWVEAQNLNEGDKISIQAYSGLWGNKEAVGQLDEYFDENTGFKDRFFTLASKPAKDIVNEADLVGRPLPKGIAEQSLPIFANLGTPLKMVEGEDGLYTLFYVDTDYASFTHLEELPNEDAYCLSVDSEEHSWVCNGLITKNSEILEYSDKNEVAVCNLASISLPYFIDRTTGEIDYKGIENTAYELTRNLNNVIDVSYYPVKEAKVSNMRHRPIGIGVQGLADLYALSDCGFDSDKAKGINKEVFAALYHGFIRSSCDLAKAKGRTYETFEGSPMSEGKFQFDLWGIEPSDKWDWESLRKSVLEHGVFNSLGVAPMPTASCQTSDTEIVTDKGVLSYRDIMDLCTDLDYNIIEKTDTPRWYDFDKSISVLTMDDEFVECDKIYYNGHKEVYELEMEDGTIFKATGNHRFLVNKGNGKQEWVTVDDLRPNDDIVNIF